MSIRSSSSTTSQSSSTSSSDQMATFTSFTSPHPFLTPGRASTISSWTSTLPERSSGAHQQCQSESKTPEATVEAYRLLKLALFSKAMATKRQGSG
ncbi:hypothetical protein IAQ61_011107 [Plenodomus lingam]|nr:hypothetical protein IAQ61_011107 [Plenodomus lingam]